MSSNEGASNSRLQILLHALKVDIAKSARDQYTEELGRVSSNVVLLSQCLEDRLRPQPQDNHWDVEEPEDKDAEDKSQKA